MQLIANGPELPPELVSKQERGEVIFVCGAGVSRGTGLPLFRGLVEGVYQRLGEDWNLHPAEREGMVQDGKLAGQYDRVLRCLERRLAASDAPRNRGMRERIRAAVRDVLKPPDNADLANHLALLELSRDAEGRNRILTTNFDTLFERAWFEQHQAAIASHAGVAMPQPKVAGCTGVLHLHGRLVDPRPELCASETDLVLTSAEFGDAYLRTGWASRYIYDLVRAHTVVLVGYQADDPPMRYLLEALEADRDRFPDLQKVYAFASSVPGNEDLDRALWAAKAVEPILYAANGDDHSALYNTLREWRKYAEDPTAWRRERLRPILSESPGATTEHRLEECAGLLGHGDACQLLGELSPAAEWLPVLIAKRVFGRDKVLPGEWIAKRVNHSSMIKACAALDMLDEQARWHINRALDGEQAALTPLRARAWRLLLQGKRPERAAFLDDGWYAAAPGIKRGEADFDARRLVRRILQPRLKIGKVLRWEDEAPDANAAEDMHDLMRLEFEPANHPPATEILAAWPQDAEQEIALFRTLDRALADALEEAHDIGLLDGWDRASHEVPSIATHAQNAHRSGFYPITRALADLWHRIVGRDANRARALVQHWANSPFLLVQRLSMFAHQHAAYTPEEGNRPVLALSGFCGAAFGEGGFSDCSPAGKFGGAGFDLINADVFWFEGLPIPFNEAAALWMVQVRHGLDKVLEAGDAADVFWRGASFAFNETGIFMGRICIGDRLDGKRVLPVIAKIIGVGQARDTAIYQRAEFDVFGVGDIGPAIRIGNAVAAWLAVDLHGEAEEMIIFKQHRRLNDFVQAAQTGGERRLDTTPDHRFAVIQSDLYAGDAVNLGRRLAHVPED